MPTVLADLERACFVERNDLKAHIQSWIHDVCFVTCTVDESKLPPEVAENMTEAAMAVFQAAKITIAFDYLNQLAKKATEHAENGSETSVPVSPD